MAELVLGALGVVPLIGFTIKSYHELSSRIKTFRHCSSVVLRLYKKLRVQRRVFENECQLLLRECLRDDAVVEAMMADPNHEEWNDRTLNEKLKEALKQNYEDCSELIQDIVEAVRQIEGSLDCFKAVKSKQQKDECLKKAWKRVVDGLRISFNKSDYESSLDDLKDGNYSLKTLREQITKLQKPSKDVARKRPAVTAVGWADIRQASKTLHEALIEAWSCTQASHLRHSVKLFVEAEKADDDVQMEIAILCHGHNRGSKHVDLIQLQVRSSLMMFTPHPHLLLPLPVANDRRPHKRIKAVRFQDEVSQSCSMKPDPQSTISTSSDLRGSADICMEFTARCDHQVANTSIHYLGHIDISSEESYRHQFFTASRYVGTGRGHRLLGADDLMPMDAILETTRGDSFSTVDKLKMAKALVQAVLKFHTTPWLGEAWRLQDLAFFHYCQDLTRSLRTLHVGVDFDRGNLQQMEGASPLSMEDIRMTSSRSPPSQASEDERLLCGIDNLTLHCLGVALLQIDRLKSVEPEDVLTVRKMAKASSSLGPKYREITEKCLRCDFGYGTDLSRAQLQKAVYNSVVGVLESMISVLDINDDDDDGDDNE